MRPEYFKNFILLLRSRLRFTHFPCRVDKFRARIYIFFFFCRRASSCPPPTHIVPPSSIRTLNTPHVDLLYTRCDRPFRRRRRIGFCISFRTLAENLHSSIWKWEKGGRHQDRRRLFAGTFIATGGKVFNFRRRKNFVSVKATFCRRTMRESARFQTLYTNWLENLLREYLNFCTWIKERGRRAPGR